MPKHKGNATKKTTILDEKSDFKFLNNCVVTPEIFSEIVE